MTQASNKNSKLLSLGVSVLFAALLTLILMLITAGLMLSAGLSGMGISAAVIFINIIPIFLASFFLGKKVGEKKFLWGIAAAVMFFCLYIIVALLFQNDLGIQIGGYIKTFIIMLLSGMLGGMFS